MRSASVIFSLVLLAFLAGFASHVLYRRWNPITQESQARVETRQNPPAAGAESPTFRVNFVPFAPSEADTQGAELTAIVARDVDKIRSLTGQQVRIRGRVFRVGYSAKSNTYFINFGPSRQALTAVIFNSAVELFEKNKQSPKQFENREVEIVGFVKDHPQYGLEVILEDPKQIKIVN